MAKFCFINGEILPSKKAVIGIDELIMVSHFLLKII